MIKKLILFFSIIIFSSISITVYANNSIQVSIKASFDQDNLNISSGTINATYGSRIKLDSSITNEHSYAFLYWIINGTIQEDLPIDYEHIVTSSLDAHAIFHPNNRYVATFIDTNGIVLDFQYISPGGNADDTEITLPDKPGYIVAPYKWDKPLTNINTHTIFTVQYIPDNLPTLALNVVNGVGSGAYTFNTVVTVEANEMIDDQYFQYWSYNGDIFSYQATTQFTLLDDMTLTAIYDDEPILSLPLITLSEDLAKRNGYKSYVGQIYVPEGFELIEYGVITSLDQPYMDLDSNNTNRYQGISLNEITNEFAMSITANSHTYVQGYLVVENYQNELLVFYSGEILTEVYYVEDFTNASLPGGTSYGNATYNGLHGVTWNLTHVVDSGAYSIDGKGVLLRRASDSKITATIPNGISSFSFDYRKAFTGSVARIIEVTINGAVYDLPSFGAFTGEDATVFNFSVSDLNLTGNVSIQIKLKGSETTNAHVVIDNITWGKAEPSRELQGYILATSSNVDEKPIVNLSGPYYDFEEEIEITAPEVTGYTFIHWMDLRTDTIISEQNPYVFDIISNRSIKAIYASNETVADYTVEYYYQNIEDNLYTLTDTETFTRPIGELRELNPTQYGFTLDTDLSILSGYVSDTNPLVLKVYFARNLFTVDFMVGETLYESQIVKYQGVPESVTDPVKPSDPFDGWSVMSIGRTLYNLSLPVTQNLTLYAVFESTPDYVYEGYYEGADDLTGEDLVGFLRTLVNTNINRRSYDEARTLLAYTDQDPNNASNVLTIYDRTSVSGTWDNGATWNREHVWPNSRLGIPRVNGSSRNIGTDLHNLRAANPSTNSSRSNKVFDNVITSLTYFPGDQDKGDVARILFYMVIAYQELELVEDILENDPDTNYKLAGAKMSVLSTLLVWHIEDPVDDFERERNNRIYEVQNNKNPFIDHPQFVEMIFGPIELSTGDYIMIESTQHESNMNILHITTLYDVPKKQGWVA